MSGTRENFLESCLGEEGIFENDINLTFQVETKKVDKEDNEDQKEKIEDRTTYQETKKISSNNDNNTNLNLGDVNLEIALDS